jgi:hypothetical protein
VKKTFMIIVCVVIGVILFASWFSGISRVFKEKGRAVSVMNSYGDALQHGDYQSAYQHMSSDAMKTQTFPDFVRSYESLVADEGSIQSISFGSYEVSLPRSSPWTATFAEEITFPKGTLRFNCVLHYEKTDWKIQSCDEM